MIKYNHFFDSKDVRILESNYNKRLISEMLHIKEQSNGFNLIEDTEFLDKSYYCLLDILSNNKWFVKPSSNDRQITLSLKILLICYTRPQSHINFRNVQT